MKIELALLMYCWGMGVTVNSWTPHNAGAQRIEIGIKTPNILYLLLWLFSVFSHFILETSEFNFEFFGVGGGGWVGAGLVRPTAFIPKYHFYKSRKYLQ